MVHRVVQMLLLAGLVMGLFGWSGCATLQDPTPRFVHRVATLPERGVDRTASHDPSRQIAIRPALSTCYATTTDEGQDLRLAAHYSNLGAVGIDDIYIEECLKQGGSWQALASNAP